MISPWCAPADATSKELSEAERRDYRGHGASLFLRTFDTRQAPSSPAQFSARSTQTHNIYRREALHRAPPAQVLDVQGRSERLQVEVHEREQHHLTVETVARPPVPGDPFHFLSVRVKRNGGRARWGEG